MQAGHEAAAAYGHADAFAWRSAASVRDVHHSRQGVGLAVGRRQRWVEGRGSNVVSHHRSAAASVAGLQARDVVAFGHEIGRALSDGRIVGRAEPFAKVFASSREVKRAVGLVAWAILEDIALDAHLDDAGRLIATTNVRRIAANLAINKDTAAKHLARLRDYGFVLQEEGGHSASGRWETCRYILDPSACLERFTHTPTGDRQPGPPDGAATGADPGRPCPRDPDTATITAAPEADAVSETTGHGQPGHNNKKQVPVQEEQQLPSTDAIASLVELGIDPTIAAQLTATHPAERIVALVAAARARQIRNPAGWARAALDERWDLTIAGVSGEPPPTTPELPRDPDPPAATPSSAQRWATMLAAALDDRQLDAAIRLVTAGLPARAAASPRVVRARLLAWVQDLHRHDPHRPIEMLITRALNVRAQQDDPQRREDTPSAAAASSTARTALATRVRALLQPHGTPPAPAANTRRGSPHAAEASNRRGGDMR
jgi:hypothetical protein